MAFNLLSGTHGVNYFSESDRAYGWALRMTQTIRILQCPRCSCRMQRITFLTQPGVIRRFLESIAKREEPP